MKNLLTSPRSLRGILALGAALLVLPLTSLLSPAKADPPRRAPAYGYRRKTYTRSYTTRRPSTYRRPSYNRSYSSTRTFRRYTPERRYNNSRYNTNRRVYGTYRR